MRTMKSSSHASMAGNLNRGYAYSPAKSCSRKVSRKGLGTEIRPFLSILLTYLPTSSAMPTPEKPFPAPAFAGVPPHAVPPL